MNVFMININKNHVERLHNKSTLMLTKQIHIADGQNTQQKTAIDPQKLAKLSAKILETQITSSQKILTKLNRKSLIVIFINTLAYYDLIP